MQSQPEREVLAGVGFLTGYRYRVFTGLPGVAAACR
jgi:hypothetical protein